MFWLNVAFMVKGECLSLSVGSPRDRLQSIVLNGEQVLPQLVIARPGFVELIWSKLQTSSLFCNALADHVLFVKALLYKSYSDCKAAHTPKEKQANQRGNNDEFSHETHSA